MTFGFQCDEDTSVRHPRPRLRGRASPSSTPPTPTRSAAAGRTAGRTEDIIGRWMQGKRDDVILATKCHYPMGRRPWDRGNSRQHIMERHRRQPAAAAHRPHRPLPAARARPDARRSTRRLRALDDLVRAGKVRYVGCSNFLAYQVARSHRPHAEVLGHGPLRQRAAPLQPAVPRDRARAAAAVRRGGHRGDPLQPARRRPAHGQAPAATAARPRARASRSAPPPTATRTATGTTASSTPSTSSGRSPTRPACR